ETRLILIFAGWSTDARYYNDCVAEGWDTAVVYDYRDMSFPELPSQYSTIYIFAYSLGVWAASICDIPAAARIAICGSPLPVSDNFGIPEAIYSGTASGLDERNLLKFHIRMAGDRKNFETIKKKFPDSSDIPALKEELLCIATMVKDQCKASVNRFDKVYIALKDKIFPYVNLNAYWNTCPDTVAVSVDAPHAVDIAEIIRDCVPDTAEICESFERARTTYGDNAVIQSEICGRMGDALRSVLKDSDRIVHSLLEIGVGGGQLTEIWRNILTPESATYIDLFELPVFGIAQNERYIVGDAEEWLKSTDESFDMILSASTIQWFADPVNFIHTVKRHLNPGGIAVLSTFVKGNLHQLDMVRPCPVIYRTAEEYRNIPGVEAVEWERTLTFPSSRAMMMHLRLTG
ncbi:MAG: DUF452 family protein, partial [Muribaculaceae bacterium]|nr:DUF452 family protein [Muribaculaceae bacterium]